MTRVAAALALLLLGSTASAAAEEDKLGKLLGRLPASVRRVESAGGWGGPRGSGFYRAIVLQGGADAVVEELVVQWVLESDAGTPVVASIRPNEVNDAGLVELRVGWEFRSGAPVQLVVDGTQRVTGKRVRVRLELGPPGTYRIERPSRDSGATSRRPSN